MLFPSTSRVSMFARLETFRLFILNRILEQPKHVKCFILGFDTHPGRPSFFIVSQNQEFAMADSPIDYTVVLADLKAKRAHLDSAITAIEVVLGLQSAVIGVPTGGTNSTGSGDLGPGAFL